MRRFLKDEIIIKVWEAILVWLMMGAVCGGLGMAAGVAVGFVLGQGLK
jgi:hypothetical protein